MKQNKYNLRIDNPCRQEWTSMAESQSGRFCSHCSKLVIDFTCLSDTEIINVIERSSGKLCVRLSNQQLQKQFFQPSQYPTGLRFNKILAGLLLIAATQKTFAKKINFPVNIVSIIRSEKLDKSKNGQQSKEILTIDSSKNIVRGRVIDGNTKDFLPSVVVRIKNSNIGANSDSKGNFKLIIPDTLLSRKVVLQITYIGYEASEIAISKKDLPLIKDFSLSPAKIVMGEVVVVGYRH